MAVLEAGSPGLERWVGSPRSQTLNETYGLRVREDGCRMLSPRCRIMPLTWHLAYLEAPLCRTLTPPLSIVRQHRGSKRAACGRLKRHGYEAAASFPGHAGSGGR
jgi:hypothetical protein